MKIFLRWATHLYPRPWRDRYEREFLALLEDTESNPGTLADVVKGALLMHVSHTTVLKMIVVGGLLGAILAWAWVAAFRQKLFVHGRHSDFSGGRRALRGPPSTAFLRGKTQNRAYEHHSDARSFSR